MPTPDHTLPVASFRSSLVFIDLRRILALESPQFATFSAWEGRLLQLFFEHGNLAFFSCGPLLVLQCFEVSAVLAPFENPISVLTQRVKVLMDRFQIFINSLSLLREEAV